MGGGACCCSSSPHLLNERNIEHNIRDEFIAMNDSHSARTSHGHPKKPKATNQPYVQTQTERDKDGHAAAQTISISDKNHRNGKIQKTSHTNRFSGVQKNMDAYIRCLSDIGVITPVWVHKKLDDRWIWGRLLYNHITVTTDLHITYNEHDKDPQYKEMKCLVLKNFGTWLNLTAEERVAFEHMVLAILTSMKQEIYLCTINSATTSASFLRGIFDALAARGQKNDAYGPEIIDIENTIHLNDALKLICPYLETDCADTKWIKMGYFKKHSQISDECCEIFIQSLRRNSHVLRLDVELPSTTHGKHAHQQKEKIVKRNEKQFNSLLLGKRRKEQHRKGRPRTHTS